MKKVIFAFLLTGVVGMANVAFALAPSDTKHENEAKAVGSTLETHITNGGKVLVRGAKVSSVATSTITAFQSWGNSTVTWTIVTDGSTQFILRYGGAAGISEIQVGDFLSFQGKIDYFQSGLTVKADIVKDWSNQRKKASFNGTITSISTSSPSFALSTKSGDITVNVSSSTAITKGDVTTTIGGLMVGDRVTNTSGLYNNQTHVLTADKVKVQAIIPVEKTTFEGKLKDFIMCAAIVGQNCPSFVFTYKNADYTVFLSQDAMILTKNWAKTTVGAMKAGDAVRIYGSVRPQTLPLPTGSTSTTTATTTAPYIPGNIIDALIVRDLNIK